MPVEREDVPNRDDAKTGIPAGWVYLHPDEVPKRWRARARTVAVVSLLPVEAASLVEDRKPEPYVATEDEPLVRLVARGVSAGKIASELSMDSRTVYRRLARLRRQFEVQTTAELAALLARHQL